MFMLSVISDSHVRVIPENLGKPRVEALSDAIEQIYVDKVCAP
jgi:DNA-directed RNA polymerase subunit E'/Rpb7